MISWTRAARFASAVICFGIFTAAVSARANEPKQDTLQGWLSYVKSAAARTEDPVNGRGRFLHVDELPGLAEQARSGQPVIWGVGPYKVPRGLVHHWTGTVFIAGVTVESVAHVLAEYDQYKDFYQPLVAASSLLDKTPARDLVTLTMVQKAFSVTAAVRIENEVQTIIVDPDRMYSLSRSVRVQEISNYGRSDERLLQEGTGPGYIWQTFIITRVEQRDGGVFVEMEMLELSRGIPFEFSWLIEPLTERLPRTVMNTMLTNTKAAVEREALFSSKVTAAAPQTAARARSSNLAAPAEAQQSSNVSCLRANQPASRPSCRSSQPTP
jgi:hypothetical protein